MVLCCLVLTQLRFENLYRNKFRFVDLNIDQKLMSCHSFFFRGVFRIKRSGDTTVTQLGPQIFARITDIKTFQGVIIPPGSQPTISTLYYVYVQKIWILAHRLSNRLPILTFLKTQKVQSNYEAHWLNIMDYLLHRVGFY